MKKNKYAPYILAFFFLGSACDQEVLEFKDKCEVDPASCAQPTGTAGSANFSKFVAIGSSLTTGFQAGALFNEGQANSLPKILAKQFSYTGTTVAFNQPDINSVNGYNSSFSNPPGLILGRLILFDADGAGPLSASPTPSGAPGVPAPYNTADFPAPFAGDKAALNNFAAPGAKLIEAVNVANYGTLNPYYGRFASAPGSKTMIADIAEKGGTFFMMWLGSDDVLKYALRGAIDDPNATGANDMTPVAAFGPSYTGALNALLGASAKGVVANIPDITSIPYFTYIRWNPIPLDAGSAGALTTQLANNYNAFLNGMVAATVITQAEADKRYFSFTAGNNGVMINDETLTDLNALMAGPYAGLKPYAMARQTKAGDLIVLSASTLIGKDLNGDQVPDNGVSTPLFNPAAAVTKGDELILTSTEVEVIRERIENFNTTIAGAVAANADRVALADVNAALTNLKTAGMAIQNGVMIQPTFVPPYSAFSEDGVHPNSRGYAFTANVFIDAINAKFGATIPRVDISKYGTTKLPVTP
jgi:hypothetical protein